MRERWCIGLEVDADGHVPEGVDDFFEERRRAHASRTSSEAMRDVPSRNFLPRAITHACRNARHTLSVLIMAHDDVAIARKMHVEFERIAARLERSLEARKCVFGMLFGSTPVTIESKIAHDARRLVHFRVCRTNADPCRVHGFDRSGARCLLRGRS